jgi:hypothetical protein
MGEKNNFLLKKKKKKKKKKRFAVTNHFINTNRWLLNNRYHLGG